MEMPLATARETFAHNLRRLLDERFKGNASALARALDVNPSLISRWSRGKAFPESDDQFDRVAAACGVTVSDLFADPEVKMDLRTALRLIQEALSKQLDGG